MAPPSVPGRGESIMASRVRPREGWRVFAGEVGVIVLGVLIALAAQQAMDEWRWSRDVERTKADLDDEILSNVALGAERVAVNACLQQQLATLSDALGKGEERWTARPAVATAPLRFVLPVVYRAPNRVWTTDVWEQAKASGVVGHMNPADVANYSGSYAQIADLRAQNDSEVRLAPSLAVLGYDGRMDAATRDRVLSRLAELDSLNTWIVLIADQVAEKAASSNRRMPPEMVRETKNVFATQRRIRGRCVDSEAGWKLIRPLMAPADDPA